MNEPDARLDDPSASFLVRHRTWLLVGVAFLFYLPFLGLRDLWYPDEPDIAEVCLSMFKNGDWIAPRRLGVIWVDYPPMLYWTGTVFSHLFGAMSEFSLRLPNMLASVAQIGLVSVTASRWFGPRAGLWAGFALFTSLQFNQQAIEYRPDVALSLAVAAGLLAYARGCGDRSNALWRIAGFACFGLAMLSKGPLGLLLPGLVLTLWHGTRREWRRLFEMAPLTLVALAVYAPWFLAVGKAMGSDNLLHEFYAQNIERFYSGERGHARPIFYYLLHFWSDLAPFAVFLPFALRWIHRTGRWRDRNVQLAMWWLVAFLLILSIAVTKRNLYLLPAYPAVALLLAPWLARVGHSGGEPASSPSPRPVQVYSAVIACLLGLLGVIGLVLGAGFESWLVRFEVKPLRDETMRALHVALFASGIVLVAVAAWVAAAWRSRDTRAQLVRIGGAFLALFALSAGLLLPSLNPEKTYRPQGAWIAERIGDAETFGIVSPRPEYYGKAGGFGYYSDAIVQLLESGDEVERFLIEHPGTVVLVHERRADEIFAGREAVWQARIVRELSAVRDRFFVVELPSGE